MSNIPELNHQLGFFHPNKHKRAKTDSGRILFFYCDMTEHTHKIMTVGKVGTPTDGDFREKTQKDTTDANV